MQKLKQISKLSTIVIVIISSLVLILQSQKLPNTFQESKELLKEVYKYHNFTTDFYCQAPFAFQGNTMVVLESEAYTPRKAFTKKGKENLRVKRIEFEHIMPAENFGKHLACWHDKSKGGGRKACRDDEMFKRMEADIYNLVPAIGEINADRSNFRYAEAPKDLAYTQYGNCKVYTDFTAKRFYPAHYSKGLIARTYLYMSEKYKIQLSKQERQLMESWDKMYPPNEYEKNRDRILQFAHYYKNIIKIQKLIMQ